MNLNPLLAVRTIAGEYAWNPWWRTAIAGAGNSGFGGLLHQLTKTRNGPRRKTFVETLCDFLTAPRFSQEDGYHSSSSISGINTNSG